MARNYGLKLYDDASTLKAKLRMGDVTTDKEFVKSLAAGGLFAHVWTGAVLHVLNEEKVGALLRSIFTLLKPGGTYFGICAGLTDCPTAWQPEYANRSPAFLHTATSLEEVLRQVGFTEVNVTAEKRELFKVDLLASCVQCTSQLNSCAAGRQCVTNWSKAQGHTEVPGKEAFACRNRGVNLFLLRDHCYCPLNRVTYVPFSFIVPTTVELENITSYQPLFLAPSLITHGA